MKVGAAAITSCGEALAGADRELGRADAGGGDDDLARAGHQGEGQRGVALQGEEHAADRLALEAVGFARDRVGPAGDEARGAEAAVAVRNQHPVDPGAVVGDGDQSARDRACRPRLTTRPEMPEVMFWAATGAGRTTLADRPAMLAARRYFSFIGGLPAVHESRFSYGGFWSQPCSVP